MFSTVKLRTTLIIGGLALLTAPVAANEMPPAPDSITSEEVILGPIDDYAPTECIGQISNTFEPADVEQRIAALSQNFALALEDILDSALVERCVAVTSTLSGTTQNINYLHESKGVYKVITRAEPTTANAEDYLYTFDVLGVRYIPYIAAAETETSAVLDMANSTLLRAIGGTCTMDNPDYPYEADCTFAIANEDSSELSVGKLRYYF